MKNLLLLCACLWALAAPRRAVAGPPDVVVVRIYEASTIITRGEGKSEKVTFDNGLSEKNMTRSSEGYYKIVEQLYREGYVLQGTIATPYGTTNGFVTLFFAKK